MNPIVPASPSLQRICSPPGWLRRRRRCVLTREIAPTSGGQMGMTVAVCMADLGHEVLAMDIDERKIAMAANGETPFFEPGQEPQLRKNAGSLRFTTSFAEVGEFEEVHFLCVGTPPA